MIRIRRYYAGGMLAVWLGGALLAVAGTPEHSADRVLAAAGLDPGDAVALRGALVEQASPEVRFAAAEILSGSRVPEARAVLEAAYTQSIAGALSPCGTDWTRLGDADRRQALRAAALLVRYDDVRGVPLAGWTLAADAADAADAPDAHKRLAVELLIAVLRGVDSDAVRGPWKQAFDLLAAHAEREQHFANQYHLVGQAFTLRHRHPREAAALVRRVRDHTPEDLVYRAAQYTLMEIERGLPSEE